MTEIEALKIKTAVLESLLRKLWVVIILDRFHTTESIMKCFDNFSYQDKDFTELGDSLEGSYVKDLLSEIQKQACLELKEKNQ